jgi:hypothetical protein
MPKMKKMDYELVDAIRRGLSEAESQQIVEIRIEREYEGAANWRATPYPPLGGAALHVFGIAHIAARVRYALFVMG